jgi:glycosyltransferase involved in cell wall biosynthesis
MRLALRLATRVFVTSDERDFQAFCSTWGKEVARKAIRVPAMVNTTIFAPGRDRVPERTAMGMGESQPLIVSVGRIERTKGCGDAFAAFERLHKSGVRAKYVIVGDGSFRKDLERMVKDADLDNDVVFTGALARNQVAKILGSADLFLSGSWQEGFSVALLEALACGLPAVVTDVGGVRELVEDGVNGYVVKSGDKDALGRALISAVAASGTLRTTSRERALRYATKEIASRVVAEVLACCGVVIEKDADFKSKAL